MLEEPLIPCTNTQTTGMYEAFHTPYLFQVPELWGL